MKKFNYKGLEVSKYSIIRMTQYTVEEGVMYAPSDMIFYQTFDANNKIKFNGKTYSQKNFVGITPYSKIKEKITHNMHWNISGEKDDYPVVNSYGVTVYNIINKYLIWELTDIDINDDIPISENKPIFEEPIYALKSAKSEDTKLLEELLSSREDTSTIDFNREFHRPYLYVKIHGLSDNGDKIDCTTIMTSSWNYRDNKKVNKIERYDLDFRFLSTSYYDPREIVCLSNKEEFENEFNKMIQTFNI